VNFATGVTQISTDVPKDSTVATLRKPRVFKSNNASVLKEVDNYLDSLGSTKLKVRNLHQHLLTVLPENLQPSKRTLERMLNHRFHLRYGKFGPANFKYGDPAFDEKRLWVTRLLAQFFLEEVVLISVDESNFRSDVIPRTQWSFSPLLARKRLRQQSKAEETQNKR
jgi:hypothetical protein